MNQYTQEHPIHTCTLRLHFVSSPGSLFPLVSISITERQLVELSEEVMRNVLLIIILSAEDKLDPL